MAFVIADRVRETTTTIGTGSVTLGGAYISFQTFSAAIGNGNNTYYTIASASSGEWEVGIGTYASGGNLLSRDTVLASSAGGAKVSFSVGSKDVFVTQPAERSLLLQSGGSGLFAGNAAFTANGLLYANATTTATTSSALTFDGTTLTASASASASGNFKTTSTSAQVYNLTASNDANTTIGLGVFGSAAGTFGTLGAGTPFLATSAATMVQNVQNASGVFVWGIGATPAEQMRLTSTGLGIGTNSPAYKLDVVGTAAISGAITLSGGTANGVAYLNGSNVLTTGSALTFDGTRLGLGTSSPLSILDVVSNSTTYARVRSTAAALAGHYYQNSASGTTTADGLFVGLNGSSEGFIYNFENAPIVFGTNNAERMRLDPSGNLGIGTSSPGAKLDVNGGTTSEMRLTTSGSGYLQVGQFTNGAFIGTSSTDATAGLLRLGTGGTTRATIDSSGNLGIGTSSPGAKLESVQATSGAGGWFVAGQFTAANYPMIRFAATSPNKYSSIGNNADGSLRFFVNGTSGTVGSIAAVLDPSGNLGVGTSSPSSFSGYTTVSIDNATNGGILNLLVNSTETARLQAYSGIFNVAAKGAATNLTFETNGSERMRLNPSGNLGLGVTPSAWGSVFKAIQAGSGAAFVGSSLTSQSLMLANTYSDASGLKYINTAQASYYQQYLGVHSWYTAPSGTAGNAITFTQAMTLDASGNLGLGVTPSAWSASWKALQVGGSSALWGIASGAGATFVSSNTLFDGAYKYINTGTATYYAQSVGAHSWHTAPSGTAGNAITFTQAMTLTAGGGLQVGTTSASGSKLLVYDNRSTSSDGTEAAVWVRQDGTNAIQAWLGSGGTERMRLDSSGNLGLGVTPSAWGAGWKALEVGPNAASAFLMGGGDDSIFGNSCRTTDGNSWYYTYSGVAPSKFRQQSGRFEWYTAPSGTAGNAISFTQAMTLTAAGNQLLGQTTEDSNWKLQVNGGLAGFRLNYDRASYASIFGFMNHAGDSGGVEIGNINGSSDQSIRFSNGSTYAGRTERARIDSSGNLLVGTTTAGGNGWTLYPTGSGGGVYTIYNRPATSNTTTALAFQDGGTTKGSISYTNTATSYNTSSDYRLKEDIQPMTGALAKVQALKPCTYKWKVDGSDGEGFIAHELAEVVPQAVTGSKDAVNEDGSIKPQGIDTSFLVATLAAAIQELKADLDTTKAELAALKGA